MQLAHISDYILISLLMNLKVESYPDPPSCPTFPLKKEIGEEQVVRLFSPLMSAHLPGQSRPKGAFFYLDSPTL